MKPDANRNRPVLACLALCLTLSARAVGQDTWLKTFEVGSAMTDSGASVAPTPDGGLVVGGRTSYLSSPSWAGHATIRKLKPDGSLEWQQILGTSSVSQGVGEVRPTSDGGFVLAGSEAGEPWVVKLDAGGSVTWQRRYRALDIWQEVYSHVSEALNGDFLLAGSLRRTHNSTGDVQVVRIAPDGQLLWAKIFGGADEEFVWRLRATASGGCVVGGATWSVPASGGNEDAWVFELDPAGQVVWSKTYGTAGPHSIQRVRGLATTRDGGVIVTGSSALLGFDQDDLWVAELDAVGNVRWERTYGSGLWEEGRAISRMASGGYVVAGRSSTDAISGDKGWLLRIGADGQLLWQQILGGLGLESLTDVVASGVEHLAVVGTTWDGQGHQAMLTARIRRDGSLESCEELTETFAGVSVASSVVADFGPQVRDSDVQVFTPLAAPLAGPNVEATLCPGVVLPGQGWCFGDGSVTSCPCAVGYHGPGGGGPPRPRLLERDLRRSAALRHRAARHLQRQPQAARAGVVPQHLRPPVPGHHHPRGGHGPPARQRRHLRQLRLPLAGEARLPQRLGGPRAGPGQPPRGPAGDDDALSVVVPGPERHLPQQLQLRQRLDVDLDVAGGRARLSAGRPAGAGPAGPAPARSWPCRRWRRSAGRPRSRPPPGS